jgi:amidase
LLPVRQRLERVFGTFTPLNASLPDIDEIYLAFRQIQGFEAWQAQGRR